MVRNVYINEAYGELGHNSLLYLKSGSPEKKNCLRNMHDKFLSQFLRGALERTSSY